MKVVGQIQNRGKTHYSFTKKVEDFNQLKVAVYLELSMGTVETFCTGGLVQKMGLKKVVYFCKL